MRGFTSGETASTRASAIVGVTMGALAVIVAGIAFALLRPEFAVLEDTARPMSIVLSTYAAVVVLAFLPWRLAGVELRTFISVTVFGTVDAHQAHRRLGRAPIVYAV